MDHQREARGRFNKSGHMEQLFRRHFSSFEI
jgi:hypothetical protein